MTQKNSDPLNSLQTLQSGSRSDQLIEQLVNMIITEIFPPGYTFPNENNMCKYMNVGRSTLREAYKVLAAYGLITRTKNGTVVNQQKDFNVSALIDFDIERSDYDDLMEFRIILETKIAMLAAERSTEDEREDLQKLYNAMEKNIDNLPVYIFNDVAFHIKLAEMSHNKLLFNIMLLAKDNFFKSVLSAFKRTGPPGVMRSLAYHKKLLKAISEGNSSDAGDAMQTHILNVREQTK